MKKIVLTVAILFGGYFAADVKANHNDTVLLLKEKIEKMEKQVTQLQAELKTMRSTDSVLSADLKAIQKTTPATAPRKLVIDRRGSKQAYLQ